MSRALGLLTLAALLVAACGGGGEAGPPAILYGEDICDRCRMVISEERHAAGAVIDGHKHRFDDPGCLRTFLVGRPAAVASVWVHDQDGGWLAAEDAWFVHDPEVVTPMGSGILAYGSRQVAAGAGAEPLRWAELRALPQASAE